MMMNLNKIEESKQKPLPKSTQETCCIIFLFVIHVLVSWLSIYLLDTPISEWFFDFSQYTQTIVDIFPKAQYWSNASVAYREKMIVLYGIIKPVSWGMVCIMFFVMLSQYKKHLRIGVYGLAYRAISFDNFSLKKSLLSFIWLTFLLYCILFLGENGSEVELSYEDLAHLRYLRASDYNQFNTKMGFYFFHLFLNTLGVVLLIFVVTLNVFLLLLYIKRR